MDEKALLIQVGALVGAGRHDGGSTAAAPVGESFENGSGYDGVGFAQGHQPHRLDTIELGRVAWDKITQETITR